MATKTTDKNSAHPGTLISASSLAAVTITKEALNESTGWGFGVLAMRLLRDEPGSLRKLGLLLLGILLLQISFGITNVPGHLPLPVTVAHNGGAALLLLTLITTLWMSRRQE